jgi:hypothetical protein
MPTGCVEIRQGMVNALQKWCKILCITCNTTATTGVLQRAEQAKESMSGKPVELLLGPLVPAELRPKAAPPDKLHRRSLSSESPFKSCAPRHKVAPWLLGAGFFEQGPVNREAPGTVPGKSNPIESPPPTAI